MHVGRDATSPAGGSPGQAPSKRQAGSPAGAAERDLPGPSIWIGDGSAPPGEVIAYLDALSVSSGEVVLPQARQRPPGGRHGSSISVVYRDAGGAVGGYGRLEPGPDRAWSGEQVSTAPGAGGAVLETLARAAAQAGAERVELWARPAGAGEDAAAAAAGRRRERSLLRLIRDLPLGQPVGAAPLPGGALVRPFRPGADEREWLEVNARAFAALADQGGWTLEDLLERETEPWFDPAGFVVLELAGRIAGFCWTKLHQVPGRGGPPLGEIYVIGVDPRAQRGGLGAALLRLGCESLARRGAEQVMLYVDGANAAALALYDRAGFGRDREDRSYGGHPAGAPEVAG